MTRSRNPFPEFERLVEQMQSGLEEAGRWWVSGPFAGGTDDTAAVGIDLEDGDEELVLTAELPGFDAGDIVVRMNGRTLRLAAEREAVSEDAGGAYIRRERRRASVTRSIPLPATVETDDVSATYDDGIPTVHLPRSEPTTGGTRIEVT